MMQDLRKPILAPGYTKQRGENSGPRDMTVDTKWSGVFDKKNPSTSTVGVLIRVGVARKPGDRALDDLVENAILLTVEQARGYAEWILATATGAERVNQDLPSYFGKEPDLNG